MDAVARDSDSSQSTKNLSTTTTSSQPADQGTIGSSPLSRASSNSSIVTVRAGNVQGTVAPLPQAYPSVLCSQDTIRPSNVGAARDEADEVSQDPEPDTSSVITVVRNEEEQDKEADIEEVLRPETPSSTASCIAILEESPCARSSDLVLRSPRGSASSGSPTLANSSPRSPFRAQLNLWRQVQKSPLLRTEWTEVLPESPESGEDTEAEVSTCQMAVTWRERLLHECIDDLRSEAYAAEASASMRDIDIANMEDDHAAEVGELKEEIAALKERLEEQREELDKANKKKNQQHNSWAKANREKLQLKKELEMERTSLVPLKKQVGETATESANLQQALAAERARTARLERSMTNAVKEVGFLTHQCGFYRCAMEDADPARTAFFDGHILRQQEEICRLKDSLRECQKEIPRLTKLRDADKIEYEGEVTGLKKELQDLEDTLAVTMQSRDQWLEEFEKVAELFKQKICFDDMVKVICDDRDVLKEDNFVLSQMLQRREARLADTFEEMGSRDADLVGLKYVLRAEKAKADVVHGEKAQLVQQVEEVRWIGEMREAEVKEKLATAENANGQLQRQVAELQHRMQSSLPVMVQQMLIEKNREIRRITDEYWAQDRKLKQASDQLRMLGEPKMNSKGLPIGSTFFGVGGLQDWNGVELRQRLNFAEAQMVPGQVEVLREVGEKGPLRVWFDMYGEGYGVGNLGSGDAI